MISMTVTTDGTINAVYADDLIDLGLGEISDQNLRRASHVEMGDGGWYADLSPVNGPTFGPFLKRQAALAKEMEWLRENGF